MNEKLSWMWDNGLSAAAYWPADTAHTVKTKQNPFNKYLCTQCYIHVLYIGTQEWVWIVISLLKTQKCVFAIAVRCMVVVKIFFFLINSFLFPEPSSTIKSHLRNTLGGKTCSTYSKTLLPYCACNEALFRKHKCTIKPYSDWMWMGVMRCLKLH